MRGHINLKFLFLSLSNYQNSINEVSSLSPCEHLVAEKNIPTDMTVKIRLFLATAIFQREEDKKSDFRDRILIKNNH